MKKLVLVCAVSMLSILSGAAQGTVAFVNDNSTLVITNDLLGHIGTAKTTDLPRVALYYSIAATAPAINTSNFSDLSGWTLSSPTTPDAVIVPGRFVGGTQTLNDAIGGSTIWLMVRGWTGGYADWMSAVNAASQPGSTTFLGITEAWQQATGDPTLIPPGTPVPMVLGTSGFNGLTLSPIPEPSTIGLCWLGGIAAACFRSGRNSSGRRFL
jgi:hypothetical protein